MKTPDHFVPTPKIYVACLASYNAGILHGVWLEANQDINALYKAVRAMLGQGPMPGAEEWAIHGHEDFCGIKISEHCGLEEISEIANFIMAYGELGAKVVDYLQCEEDLDKAKEAIEDCYQGQYASKEEFMREHVESVYSLPEGLAFYLDYELLARDHFSSDFFSIELNGAVHVFSSC